MDELIEAPPTTALEPPPLRRSHPSQLLQGILTFLAVVGIGAAATVLVHPPLRLRVVTVEKTVLTPVYQPAPPAVAVAARPAVPVPHPRRQRPTKPETAPEAKPEAKPESKPLNTNCTDPLCGVDELIK